MAKPVYALVGKDLFLQIEALRRIVREAGTDAARIDMDGETAPLADVLDELRTFAMFATTKVVIVRDAGAFITRYRGQLEAFLAEYTGDSGSLVLRVESLPSNQKIHKLIAKTGQIIECKPPNDVVRWSMQRARDSHGLSLSREAAFTLVDLIGDDLGRLDNELAKLALMGNGIDPARITETVAFVREQEMYKLTDDLTAGRRTQAIHRWRQLMQTDPSTEYRAITWLTMWLEKVRRALGMQRAGVAPAVIAAELKVWPASAVPAFFSTVKSLGPEGAARLVSLLTQVDYRSKTGVGEMAQNVEWFLLQVARGA